MKRSVLISFVALVFLDGGVCLAGSAEDWIRKASNATAELAQGNTQGALSQAAPNASVKLSDQTYFSAGLSGANLQQGIAPLSRLNTRNFGFDGSYNLGSNYGLNDSSPFSNNFQVSARNPFFTNTTTTSFAPRFRRSD